MRRSLLLLLSLALLITACARFRRGNPPTTSPLPVSTPPATGSAPSPTSVLPSYAYTTDQIVLKRRVSVEGYTLEWHQNKAYTCSRRGYHTFLIAYPSEVSPATPQAL